MKFERKGDFAPLVGFWGAKVTLFWGQKKRFLVIFLDFYALFGLNLAKKCTK